MRKGRGARAVRKNPNDNTDGRLFNNSASSRPFGEDKALRLQSTRGSTPQFAADHPNPPGFLYFSLPGFLS